MREDYSVILADERDSEYGYIHHITYRNIHVISELGVPRPVLRIFSRDAGVPVTDVVIGQITINDRPVQCMDELELAFAHCENVTIMLASVDKGTHARGPDWAAVCCVIVLDIRRYACVLCLADNAPDRPASPSEFFTEDKRRLARQTRQAGCRPPTRITTPDAVLPREKPCVPLSADAIPGQSSKISSPER